MFLKLKLILNICTEWVAICSTLCFVPNGKLDIKFGVFTFKNKSWHRVFITIHKSEILKLWMLFWKLVTRIVLRFSLIRKKRINCNCPCCLLTCISMVSVYFSFWRSDFWTPVVFGILLCTGLFLQEHGIEGAPQFSSMRQLQRLNSWLLTFSPK